MTNNLVHEILRDIKQMSVNFLNSMNNFEFHLNSAIDKDNQVHDIPINVSQMSDFNK